jgi:hypothetical protein
LEKSREIVNAKKPSFLELVRAIKILKLQRMKTDSLDVEIQAFRIGDAALVALPGEVFVELGLLIKEYSPFKSTMVVELANDSIHYVPTVKAFSEGSYEVVNSVVAPGGGELIAGAALDLLRQLKEK